MKQVQLKTATGIIEGNTSFNHTGNETNLIMIEFEYEGIKYKYPFSRKTGKLYACYLPFEIRLLIDKQ